MNKYAVVFQNLSSWHLSLNIFLGEDEDDAVVNAFKWSIGNNKTVRYRIVSIAKINEL